MNIISPIRKMSFVSAFILASNCLPCTHSINSITKDEFVKVDTTIVVPPQGTTDISVLSNAPSADVYIKSNLEKAKIVVDLNKNILYKYDDTGTPKEAFLVASGKKSTPTDPGIRIVSHVESYPYRSAPRKTKRRRNPRAYGPNIIILKKINITNGVQSSCGEFIHGNKDASSIGKYASLGCIRMDNDVIKELSKQVKQGDIVKIIK